MKFKLRILAVLALLFGGFSIGNAASITVTSINDTQANDGLCTLREAIINANNNDQSGSSDCAAGNSGGFPPVFNFIGFAPELIGETIDLNGSQLPTVTKTLFIVGPVPGRADGLTIHGNQTSRLINVEGSSAGEFSVLIRDLTLTGGRTTGNGNLHGGGAIRAINANVSLRDVVVSGSSTAGEFASGGGIYLLEGTLNLLRAQILDNYTENLGSGGGGIGVGSFATVLAARIERSLIAGNSTFGIGASGGGASIGGKLELIDSIVSNNQASGSGASGGGLVNSGELLMEGSSVYGNLTTGGPFIDDAANGGGIYLVTSHAVINNSTVSNNAALGNEARGGGIFGTSHSLTIHHLTAFGNASHSGAAGIHADQEFANVVEIHNSLLVQTEVGQMACYFETASVTQTLATDASCTGQATLPQAIAIGPLTANGGFTPTHDLAIGSVAIDAAGDCVADWGMVRDQRGVSRPYGTSCDIGAVEYAPDKVFTDRFE